MKEFLRKHEDRIHSVLSCFDRMLFRRYLPIMSGWAMAQFLNILKLDDSKLDNVLISVGDITRAPKFADRFQRLKWPKILNRYARLVNPQMQGILRPFEYYWVTAQSEYSTDIQFNPLAYHDIELFQAVMAGEHCLIGFTNRDIRSKLQSTQHLRSCGQDPKKASSKVSRILRRFHAHGLIAKLPRTRRWRVTLYGRRVMGIALYLREHDFARAYAKMAA
jgi:hypothetical protein